MKARPYLILVLGIIFTIIEVWLSGCATDHNYVKFHDKNEQKAAEHCGVWYPVNTNTKTTIKTVKGKTDTLVVPGDVVYVDCEEAVKNALDEASKSHVAVKCPPTKVIHEYDTVYTHDTTVEENTAELRACILQKDAIAGDLSTSNKDRDKYKAEKRSWEYRAIGTWLVLLILLVLWLAKKFGKFAAL